MPAPSRALVIAIENYPDAQGLAPALPGASQAAGSFIAWLKDKKGVAEANILQCRDAGATRQGILTALKKLIQDGRDNTGEFFLFFSGHGLGFEQSSNRRAIDVLVASDFTSAGGSGGDCLKLDELQDRLFLSLGGTDHYFFIDACRNPIGDSDIQVLDMGVTFPRAELGSPSMYTIYSTAFGEPARIKSGFSDALLKGLDGAGHAKGRYRGAMYVKFDRLCQYVQERVTRQKIDSSRNGNGLGLILKLQGPIRSECGIVVEDGAPTETFDVEITAGETQVAKESFQGTTHRKLLAPNDDGYSIRVTQQAKPVTQVEPAPDQFIDLYDPIEVKFRKSAASPSVAESMPARIPHLRGEPRTRRPDKATGLATLGASQIADFPKDRSAVHVLLGLEHGRGAKLAVGSGQKVRWRPLNETAGLDGVYQATIPVQPGSHLVSLARDGFATLTFAAWVAPNRTSFFVFAEDLEGRLATRQFLFPAGHGPPPKLVRRMALLQTRFQARQPLEPASAEDRELLQAKRLDPIPSLLAAHGMIRRGGMRQQRGRLVKLIGNLERLFPGLPDTAILARMLALDPIDVLGPPLLRESLLSLPEYQKRLALPARHLDHGSMWTCWRNAVVG